MAQPADNEYCCAIVGLHVDHGVIDEVDVGDRSVVPVLDAPGEIAQGNWSVGLVIDDSASDTQAEKLQQFFAGAIPSPLAVLTPLIGDLLG